jgi:hypothetical protein
MGSQDNLRGTQNERHILSSVRHPYIVNMHYAFQCKVRRDAIEQRMGRHSLSLFEPILLQQQRARVIEPAVWRRCGLPYFIMDHTSLIMC